MSSRLLVALRVPATPERAFEAFTLEIDRWWQPNRLFMFTAQGVGRLAFEPGEGGRLTETAPDGTVFEIGRITAWEPPVRLVFTWRQASFEPDQSTEVHVRFEPVGAETRVTVEHFGWDAIPRKHAARHGFPLKFFLLRHAEWWQTLLASFEKHARGGFA
jgi:uncharacterized protein YndB with AHSA1/START domain